MIVDHVANNIRLASNNDRNRRSEEYYRLQTPLLWVSRNFRTVVLLNLFKHCVVVFDSHMGRATAHTIPNTRFLCRLCSLFRGLAKELTISVSLETIYSGKALAALSHEPLNGCSFPLARTLKIDFTHGRDNKDDTALPPDAEDNISAFVGRVQQMAPKVNLVKSSCRFYSWDNATTSSLLFESLATQLIQFVHRVELTSGFGNAFQPLRVDAIRDLTYLHVNFEFESEQTLRLIRQSAPTLRYLSISSNTGTDFAGIIQDVDGGFVEYPRLHSFVAKLSAYRTTPRRNNFTGAVPFPSIRRLVFGGDYPFGEDLVLFRGNAATLELLKLTLTRELAVALIRQDVFTPTSHPKLQSVILTPPAGMIQVNYIDDPEIMQLLLDIGPDAAVREISHWYLDPVPRPHVFSLLNKHVNLRILSLSCLRLSIWNAMTLIQSLPLLSDLHAKAPTLDPIPAGATKRTLIKYVTSNYSPMGSRFRCWHFGDERLKELKGAVVPFLLLALACPNFDYAAIVHYQREMFAELLEKTIAMATYKKHAPRLRRLLYRRQE
ncbi:hypothetical protein GGI08_000112 [Coemansia sp. S2]|nr:hypothetical protein GGI08_000112 [Coemansia sp. S2]KAJ2353238.1 hypothetical protein GGH92_000787 [Coemansia sp. RSA 2673]